MRNMLVKQRYYYHVYGLNVESEIEMKELCPAESDFIHVVIRIGNAPKELVNPDIANKVYQATANELLLIIRDVGVFYVHNGNEIIVEPYLGVKCDSLKLFLLGSSFGALLMQRGIIPLHGSAVKVNNKCILFLGDSGAGKSTLTAALVKRGYRMLSDDVIPIKHIDEHFVAVSSYPQQKLLQNSLDYLEIKSDSLERVHYDNNKQKYYISRKNDFVSIEMKIDIIVNISITEQSNYLSLRKIYGTEKIGIILKNIYRSELIKYNNLLQTQFCFSAGIASQVLCYEMTRSRDIMTIDQQIELLLKEINIYNSLVSEG